MSKDFLIYKKIKDFIKETPFFKLEEEKNNCECEQIIFWDIDTVNVDTYSIENKITKGCLIFIISSLTSKEMFFEMFSGRYLTRIGFLRKNVVYSNFIEEISLLIDDKIPDT